MSTVSSIEFKSVGNITYHLYSDFALPFTAQLFDARMGKKRISLSLKSYVKIFGLIFINKIGKTIFDFSTNWIMKYLDKKMDDLRLGYMSLAIKEIFAENICPYKNVDEEGTFQPNNFLYGCDKCSGEMKVFAGCKANKEVVSSRMVDIEFRKERKEYQKRKAKRET